MPDGALTQVSAILALTDLPLAVMVTPEPQREDGSCEVPTAHCIKHGQRRHKHKGNSKSTYNHVAVADGGTTASSAPVRVVVGHGARAATTLQGRGGNDERGDGGHDGQELGKHGV